MNLTGNPTDLAHVAALVCSIRPEWQPGLVRIVLNSHAATVQLADLAVAAIRYANTPGGPGPKGIGWRGPHWDGAATVPVDQTPQQRCTTCGRVESMCWSARPGIDDDHPFTPPLNQAARS